MHDRPHFPFARPVLPPPQAWTVHLAESYDARWFSNGGPLCRRLEQALTEPFSGRDGVLVSSATTGIAAALIALGVRGRVAVPAFTFPATIHAIVLAGCEPVFCDIDAETLELSPAAAHNAVQALGCRAVVHVRAFGLCRDLGEIEQVATGHGVPLVVDSAAAFRGREPGGRLAGFAGDAEIFSFHATKVFAVGEGGVVLARPELADRMRRVINFAIAGSDVLGPGLNGKMSEFTAAIGLAMMPLVGRHIEIRRRAQQRLRGVAADYGALAPDDAAGLPPWQCLPLSLPADVPRDEVLDALAAGGVEGRAYYCPGLHRSTAWSRHATGELVATDRVAARMVCLPLYSDLQGDDLDEIAAVVAASLAKAKARRREGEARRAA